MDLGITLGDPSVAFAEIEDIKSKQIRSFVCVIINLFLCIVLCVHFSHTKYLIEEADGVMTITVQSNDFSLRPYIIMVEPAEHLPV